MVRNRFSFFTYILISKPEYSGQLNFWLKNGGQWIFFIDHGLINDPDTCTNKISEWS